MNVFNEKSLSKFNFAYNCWAYNEVDGGTFGTIKKKSLTRNSYDYHFTFDIKLWIYDRDYFDVNILLIATSFLLLPFQFWCIFDILEKWKVFEDWAS